MYLRPDKSTINRLGGDERERKLQVSLLCKLHSEYGGLTVKVVVEHLEEGHRSYTENTRNQSCKLEN